jgi:hypothetical protein
VSILPTFTKSAPRSFRVKATDAHVAVTMFDGKPAGTLRGPASDLLLVLWKRVPLSTVTVDGDEAAVQASLDAMHFE